MNKINYKYNGFIDKTMKFAEKEQLLKPELWRRFVQQFREDSDYDAGWRGEYWGKMMRGACFVYSYTKNKQLYDILAHTISDMLESADRGIAYCSGRPHGVAPTEILLNINYLCAPDENL